MGTETVTERPAEAAPERPAGHRWLMAGAVLVGLLGLFLRVWALGRSPVNSDEAVVGLMAEQILHGHFFAFYWGQSYGGGEPYLVAVLFAVLGHSSFTLGLTPVLLDVLAVVLTWRIGRRLLSPSVGALAAVLFWVWPEAYLSQSILEYGFRWLALDCGLGLLLVALRLADGPSGRAGRRLLDWALLGLALGLGWWASPEIVYSLVVAAGLLLWRLVRHRLALRPLEVLTALLGSLLGALPWLWANLHSSFASLQRGTQADPSFTEHLRVLAVHVVPTVLGLRLIDSGAWIVVPALGWVLYVLALLVGLALLVQLVRRRQALPLVGFVVAFPFLYAYSPFTWFWQDARYAVYLAPVLALLAAKGMEIAVGWFLGRLRTRAASAPGAAALRRMPASLGPAVLVAAALALTVGAIARLAPYTPVALTSAPRGSWTSWASDPTGFLAVMAHELEHARVHDVYTGYWGAYTLGLESHGGLVVTPLGRTYSRYGPFLREVEASARPAWLFARPKDSVAAGDLTGSSLLNPGCAVKGDVCLEAGAFMDWLSARHDPYRLLNLGDYQAVVPERPVAPERVLAAFRLRP